MSCEDYRMMLSLLVDNELKAIDLDKVETHLKDCTFCQHELEHLLRVKNMCRTIPMVEPHHNFHKNIMVKLLELKKRKLSLEARIKTYARVAAVLIVIFIGIGCLDKLTNKVFFNKHAVPGEEIKYNMEAGIDTDYNLDTLEPSACEEARGFENPQTDDEDNESMFSSGDKVQSSIEHNAIEPKTAPVPFFSYKIIIPHILTLAITMVLLGIGINIVLYKRVKKRSE